MSMAADSEFHVLAVDDSIIDRKLIERLLKTSSYQVTAVDSGSKALEFLGLREEEEDQSSSDSPSVSPKNHHQVVEVNLIITDYCMPGMTGYDLLKKIKESSNLRDIPVVIMSSEHVPARITRCLEEGAEEFFLKPVRLADLKKLKSHMMKTKQLKHQKEEKNDKEQEEESELKNDKEQEEEPELRRKPQQQPQPEQQQIQQSNSNNSSSSKRKAKEEGLSPDRRRPRYSGGVATVNSS